jgi:hypothetical protein
MMKKRINAVWIIFLIIIGIVYFFRNLSFTNFNTYPGRTSNEFLEKTYGKKFTLTGTDFYKDNGYYIWKMQYKDENDMVFNEYFFHPVEGSEGFFYIFFDRNCAEYGFRDYYWQAKVQDKFSNRFALENLKTEIGYAMPMYQFNLSNEDDIKEVADIIAVTLAYTLKNIVQLPDHAIGAYDIKYMGKRICLIRIDSEMKELAGKDYEEVFQYIYDEIFNSLMVM